ncbi:putative uncharacterized protein [Waddlia chondrophila 2032/99]|uniref:Uncharacterized protein n=2 Tax=Waddlia chondrophila TaxID=71667 RepID=D6YW88_WADCW|nr:hypothetical protein [Waddlia chondrophila]ADI38399.1 hypothetical protein wcw_1040 [Waddlia chondrophila WSU 86-1044]CCB91483.1 putative uncharacterized protein [Waddlia chondrophila 2032/99]
MVRISKQNERRNRSPRKRHPNLDAKTGSKKDELPLGYKERANAVEGDLSAKLYIPKIK